MRATLLSTHVHSLAPHPSHFESRELRSLWRAKAASDGRGLFSMLRLTRLPNYLWSACEETVVFNAKRCCHFYYACTVAMMRCCQIYCACAVEGTYWCCAVSRSTTVLPVLFRMRSRKRFLVCRGFHIYHTYVRCTALLSILLRMRGTREFLVLRSCQIYHAIVKCTRLLLTLLHSNLIIPQYLRWCAVIWSIAQGPLNLRRSFRIKQVGTRSTRSDTFHGM